MRVSVFTHCGDKPQTHVSAKVARAMVNRGEAVAIWAKHKLTGVRLVPPHFWSPNSSGMPMMGASVNLASGAARQR